MFEKEVPMAVSESRDPVQLALPNLTSKFPKVSLSIKSRYPSLLTSATLVVPLLAVVIEVAVVPVEKVPEELPIRM
jgi:hypothetical protein